jgi:hypothetical protein
MVGAAIDHDISDGPASSSSAAPTINSVVFQELNRFFI